MEGSNGKRAENRLGVMKLEQLDALQLFLGAKMMKEFPPFPLSCIIMIIMLQKETKVTEMNCAKMAFVKQVDSQASRE